MAVKLNRDKTMLIYSYKLAYLLVIICSINILPRIGLCGDMQPMTSNVRPEIKRYIDILYFLEPQIVKHTTKSAIIEKTTKIPKMPIPFAAGRYKITFKNENEERAIIFQTEEIVGHVATVVPGETVIGGYVQLLDDPTKDFGSGPKLNSEELDYFIQTIYKKFTQPLMDEEAMLLNKIKDYALAIMFSGKQGIKEYHNNQIRKLKSIK